MYVVSQSGKYIIASGFSAKILCASVTSPTCVTCPSLSTGFLIVLVCPRVLRENTRVQIMWVKLLAFTEQGICVNMKQI
jgi:hypothetical protein